jgi:hypothetical protein
VVEGSTAESIIDGWVRDTPKETKHRWIAPIEGDGAWIELDWETPQRLRQIQLTFDTGFQRELTLSSSDSTSAKIVRAPQPETVRDYAILITRPDGSTEEVARVAGNHQRLRRHEFPETEAKAVRVVVTASNGPPEARIFEVRCYG